jgi:hypothetical protein
MKEKEILDTSRFIYQLCVNDVRSVIEEEGVDLELNEDLILRIEKSIGHYIDWRSAISFALADYTKYLK